MISYDLPIDAYHDSVGISKSGLDLISKSPAHYNASMSHRREPSLAFLIGNAVHTAVLEPEEFNNRYVMLDVDFRTKEGKQAKAEAQETGREILNSQQYADVIGMRNAIMAHGNAKNLLQNGDPEVSCLEEIDGVQVRARADWLRRDNIIVDLKTTQDASPEEFASSMAKFNYHRQAAWYKHLFGKAGMEIDDFIFVCVEKVEPYAVAVYRLSDEDIEQGLRECLSLFDIYRECLLNNEWPAYPDIIQTLSLPRWKKPYETR